MKRCLFSFVVLLFLLNTSSAQEDSGQYIRPSSIGISFIFNDFQTVQRIRSSSLSTVIRNKQLGKIKDMSPGFAVTYFKGLTNHIDFAGTLGGSFVENALPNINTSGDNFLIEADASLNLKMLPDNYFFSPYLSAGVGASKYKGYYGAIVPVGAGFKFNFFQEASLFVNAKYHFPVLDASPDHHLVFGFGIAGIVGRRKPAVVKEAPQPKDTDGDGIFDNVDQCPEVPGVAKYNGCPIPDTDKDGINDDNDQCPTVAGIAKYNGCPIPDTDKDGVNDEEDRCKDVPGVARYQGCPIPDTDKDGVNDEEDKCPQLVGTRENNGCPEVKQEIQQRMAYNATRVYFITGSHKLSTKSNVALNDVVKILNSDTNLKLSIEGHTDNVGADAYNQSLSDRRANSVREYLISKGISASRLTSAGFGETQPIESNNPAAGPAQNRRVVMRVSYE
jgi:OmpA-OmpF porin, OOP family